MKKLILPMVFVFATGTMMNANNLKTEEVLIGTCYENAQAFVEGLNWDTQHGREAALEVFEALLDICDVQ
jgi:hypothetical protein